MLLLIIPHMCLGNHTSQLVTFSTTAISNNAQEVKITFIVPEKDFIYKDFITCSMHTPHVTLTPWKADKQSISHYDPSFKETKQIFNETFSIIMTATTTQYSSNPVYLYCSYYRKLDKKINHTLFTLFFPEPAQKNEYLNDSTIDLSPDSAHKKSNISHASAIIDDYFLYVRTIITSITASFAAHHTHYVSLLVLVIIILMLLFYFFKKQLQQQQKLSELIEVLFSLLIASGGAYAFVYFHTISTPLITTIIGCMCSSGVGFFYLKKSTKLQSGYLRTLCTCIGMLCIIGALFLAFKVLQYMDEQFNLFL